MSNITPGQIKKMRNLVKFRNYTDEQIEQHLLDKQAATAAAAALAPTIPQSPFSSYPLVSPPEGSKDSKVDDAAYKKKFRLKFKQLSDEYALDMNNSNDVENLKSLVRLSIQAEDADERIRKESSKELMDDRTLKNLGDFQRGLYASLADLQDKLGITRKVRKEKQFDDIPQYLKEIRRKAREKWDRSTTSVQCAKCNIELARYWLNFPKIPTMVGFEMACWKCGEKVVYQSE